MVGITVAGQTQLQVAPQFVDANDALAHVPKGYVRKEKKNIKTRRNNKENSKLREERTYPEYRFIISAQDAAALMVVGTGMLAKL